MWCSGGVLWVLSRESWSAVFSTYAPQQQQLVIFPLISYVLFGIVVTTKACGFDIVYQYFYMPRRAGVS